MANVRIALVDLYTDTQVRNPLATPQATPTIFQEIAKIIDTFLAG